MSRPPTICVFCGRTGATKSHVWPDWIAKVLPPNATHHETIVGSFTTFIPKARGQSLAKTVKPGHIGTRKPRNTCGECNNGWMKQIEESVMSIMQPLLFGDQFLLNVWQQRRLATFLCLVSMRVETSYHDMKVIPVADRDYLRKNLEAPPDWKIWIARYAGYKTEQRYNAMQIMSHPTETIGAQYCNSQVTTLAIGKLLAYLFSSTVYPEYSGYDGIELAAIWPPRRLDIELNDLPIVTEAAVPWLHESLPRELQQPRRDSR
jgi:hypothetical protein